MNETREERATGTAQIASMDVGPNREREPGREPRGELMERPPLLARENEEEFRSRWKSIQTGFVDEPRRAVQEADGLVAEVMKRLAEVFANERSGLEQQWDRKEEVSTEDLRIALQRYRSFFDRLLGM